MSISWPVTPSCFLTSESPWPPRAMPARLSPPPPAHPIAAPQTEGPTHPYCTCLTGAERAGLCICCMQLCSAQGGGPASKYTESERQSRRKEKEGWMEYWSSVHPSVPIFLSPALQILCGEGRIKKGIINVRERENS